jgi:phosphotriesterase-related protein
MAEGLDRLYDDGISTIVDLTILGQGRNVPRVKRIAERTKLNIIVAAGVYALAELPYPFRTRNPVSPIGGGHELLDQLFLRDVQEGVASTGIKVGILKCTTDRSGMTPDVERAVRAIARVHRATGVPITTHSHAGTRRGLEQQDVLAAEGVDLRRVVIGHSGDTTDLEYLEEVMRRGSYLGMDRFGIDSMLSFHDRVATVATLCQRGHADQIVLSHDAACHVDWFDEAALDRVLPNWRFTHISRQVLPALRRLGVSEEQITAMLVDNPRAFFETANGPY